jgi:hypothetical protein
MIIYAPFKLPEETIQLQQQPYQGMYQPDFYTQQQQQQPRTSDFVAAQLERIKNRAAPPSLAPGARVRPVDASIADPSNFQSYYKQLATIKQIGSEQVARAEADAALARIRASQQLNQISAANPAYRGSTSSSNIGKAGSAALGSVPSNPRANFQYAQNIAGNYGWNSPSELAAWYQLGMKESGWNNNAQNPTSTAYGIGQFLNSTWGGVGIGKTSDPALQVEAMARYIKNRYGSPSKALSFHLSHNWY